MLSNLLSTKTHDVDFGFPLHLSFYASQPTEEQVQWIQRGPVAQLDRASVFGSKKAVLQLRGFRVKPLKMRDRVAKIIRYIFCR